MLSFLLAFPLACQPDVSEASSSDTGASSAACSVEIEETWPLQGAGDAYYRGAVEFHLSEPDDSAIVVADFAGQQSTRDEGRVVVYTPDAPLEPLTTYTVTLDYCRGAPSFSFTTSAYGEPLEDGVDLTEHAWSLDLSSARFVGAEGLGEVVASLLSNALLVGVEEIDGDALSLITARADGGEQDLCFHTTILPAADFSEAPWFALEGSDVEVGYDEVVIALHDLALSGDFASDGSSIGGIRLALTADARDAAELFGISADTICEMAENAGVPCEACSDGEVYCGSLVADSLVAEAVDEPIVRIDEVGGKGCEDDEG